MGPGRSRSFQLLLTARQNFFTSGTSTHAANTRSAAALISESVKACKSFRTAICACTRRQLSTKQLRCKDVAAAFKGAVHTLQLLKRRATSLKDFLKLLNSGVCFASSAGVLSNGLGLPPKWGGELTTVW